MYVMSQANEEPKLTDIYSILLVLTHFCSSEESKEQSSGSELSHGIYSSE